MALFFCEKCDGLTIKIEEEGSLLFPRIETSTGHVYRLHDPTTWEYLSIDATTAERIAKGFPEYWSRRPNQIPPEDSTAEKAAEYHRFKELWALAAYSFPNPALSTEVSFPPPDPSTLEPSDRYARLIDPSFKNTNPFEALQSAIGQNYAVCSPDVRAWQYYSARLFHNLLRVPDLPRCPTVFPRPTSTNVNARTRDFPTRTPYAGVTITSYYSETRRMDLIRIRNFYGSVYRIYQPQTWQYLSLSYQIADDICGGFPEYWEDHPDEEREPTNAAKEAARSHRTRVLSRLAHHPIPATKEPFQLPPTYLDLFPKEIRDNLALKTSNPFLLLWRWKELTDLTNSNSPDDDTWRNYATSLFEQLALSEKVPRCEQKLCGAGGNYTPVLPEDVFHERGPSLVPHHELESRFRYSARHRVQWGPLFYDEGTVYHSHFCVAGMPRSGKTTLLRLLFQSLHRNVTPPPRFVFYDAKAKLLPYMFSPGSLQGEQLDDQAGAALYLMSPFDARNTSWDIAKDASNQLTAREIAEILFPEPDPQRPDRYFSPAARDVATEVMMVLNRKAGTQWTLFDLLSALQLKNIEAVMSSTPRGREVYETYFLGNSPATGDLPRTLRTKTALLLPAAAAWRYATYSLSLRDWVQSETKSIVLLNVKKHATASNEINRILLNILSQELLASEKPRARTFLYLDEFEHLGRIDQMTSLAHDGADQQVNLALAFHDLGTLEQVYHGATKGILGDANFRAFLKVNAPDTCNWASNQIGVSEVKVRQTSTQRGTSTHQSSSDDDDNEPTESRQSGESESEHYDTRTLALPGEISNLPMPHDSKEITGYFLAPKHGPYLGTLPESKVIRSKAEYLAAEKSEENFYALWPKVEGVSDHSPQPDERYELPDDTFHTLYDLGFRRPGYSPPPSEARPADETKEEGASQAPPPPAPLQPEPAGSTTAPQATQPPTPRDYDIDFDFDVEDK